MAFVPAPNTLMAELRYVAEGSRWENTLYFTGSAGVTPTLATTLAAALVAWWNASYKPLVASTVSLSEVFITDLTTATSFTVSYVTGLPSVGTAVGDQLPGNCSLCVSLRTANRGKSGRGRNYTVGPVDTAATASFFTTAYANAVIAAYTLFVGAGTFVAGLQFCVVSRFTNNAPRAVALIQPITSCLSTNNNVDSQRRRLPGRGR